jgi:hypothetical protein
MVPPPEGGEIAGGLDCFGGATCTVAVEGDCAYIGDWAYGLHVIDVTDPTGPRVLGGVETPNYTLLDVAVAGPHVLAADAWNGLQVLPAQCEFSSVGDRVEGGSAVHLQIAPNPAADRLTIRFAARRDGPVQASIYDLTGRRVRGLSRSVLCAGDHDLVWDGCGDEGHAVAAGSYLVRVTSPEGSTAGRFVVIR